LDAAMRDPDVAYVWVATPHSLHLEPVLAAAHAGKHVLCEKPLATSRGDAREMIRACRRAGVQLGTGFHLRHHPLFEEARRLVQAAIVLLRFSRGTLATVRCLRSVPRPQNDLLLLGAQARLAVRHSLDESTHGELEADGLDPEISGVPAGTDMYARQAEAFV